MSFISFLKHVGSDIEHGIEKAAPFISLGTQVATSINPAAGAIFSLVAGVVVQTEQKFAAIGKQAGTGVQKLADASAVLGPALVQLFQSAGWQNDAATVQKYISQVVDFFNSFPAAPVPAPPAA